MKPGKRILGPCTLMLIPSALVDTDNLMELTSLHTEEHRRGKGYATRLMDEVCQEADEDRMALILLADEGLPSFYERFGFETIQPEPCIMLRKPLL